MTDISCPSSSRGVFPANSILSSRFHSIQLCKARTMCIFPDDTSQADVGPLLIDTTAVEYTDHARGTPLHHDHCIKCWVLVHVMLAQPCSMCIRTRNNACKCAIPSLPFPIPGPGLGLHATPVACLRFVIGLLKLLIRRSCAGAVATSLLYTVTMD